MIKLYIACDSKESNEWRTQLQEWCVAHQVIENPALSRPEIKDGNKHVVGIVAIDEFLKEYKVMMDEWYDCRCDKWMDE